MTKKLIFLLLVALNFSSIKFNFIDVAPSHQFNKLRDRNSTAFVIGRIVKSRVDGIFSSGGFIGRFRVPKKYEKIPESKYQYMLFNGEADIPLLPKFYPYYSQTGGQGIFFSLLDWILSGSLSPQNRLMVFNSFSVVLLAILMSFLVTWIFSSWGYLAGVFAQVSILLSPQLILFGDNIWWQPWSYFFPFVLLLLANKRYFGAAFIGFSAKFFITGYEYITTAIILLFIPVVMKAVKDNWDFNLYLRRSVMAVCGFCVALVVSLGLLFYQHSIERGSYKAGYDHIIYSFAKRTTGAGVETDHKVLNNSFNASHMYVLNKYLDYPAIDARLLYGDKKSRWYLTCRELIYILIFLSLLTFPIVRKYHVLKSNVFSLLTGTWVALLGALSWIIIFKAHSFIHQFQNRIVFHIPFSILLAALLGFLLSLCLRWAYDYGNSRLYTSLK